MVLLPPSSLFQICFISSQVSRGMNNQIPLLAYFCFCVAQRRCRHSKLPLLELRGGILLSLVLAAVQSHSATSSCFPSASRCCAAEQSWPLIRAWLLISPGSSGEAIRVMLLETGTKCKWRDRGARLCQPLSVALRVLICSRTLWLFPRAHLHSTQPRMMLMHPAGSATLVPGPPAPFWHA